MKKETLLEIIIGTIGGLVTSVGMCMSLIEEWDMLKPGIIVSVVGILILLLIIPIYRSSHPRKEHKPINFGIVAAWVIGIVGALVMGFGMSKVMVDDVSQTDMIIGMITGVIGLIICVLDYPIYAFIRGNKESK